jgi:hypothetical protein
MKIVMTGSVSGTRNGEPWPPVGDVADVSEDEANALISSGLAEPTSKPSKAAEAESADAVPSGEKHTKKKARKT